MDLRATAKPVGHPWNKWLTLGRFIIYLLWLISYISIIIMCYGCVLYRTEKTHTNIYDNGHRSLQRLKTPISVILYICLCMRQNNYHTQTKTFPYSLWINGKSPRLLIFGSILYTVDKCFYLFMDFEDFKVLNYLLKIFHLYNEYNPFMDLDLFSRSF